MQILRLHRGVESESEGYDFFLSTKIGVFQIVCPLPPIWDALEKKKEVPEETLLGLKTAELS